MCFTVEICFSFDWVLKFRNHFHKHKSDITFGLISQSCQGVHYRKFLRRMTRQRYTKSKIKNHDFPTTLLTLDVPIADKAKRAGDKNNVHKTDSLRVRFGLWSGTYMSGGAYQRESTKIMRVHHDVANCKSSQTISANNEDHCYSFLFKLDAK